MEHGDANRLSAVVDSFGRPSCSAQIAPRDLEKDNVPTPTHNADQCEICQLHLHHLSISARTYSNTPAYDSLGAATTTAPLQSFEDGVKLGLRLQKESDDGLLNQYRKRLLRAEGERDISRRYQYEVDRLERELAETKDMLLAMQISYEESVEAHIFAQSESHDCSESAAFETTTENRADSASHLTSRIDDTHIASDRRQDLPIRDHEAPDDKVEPDSVHSSSDTPGDIEEDDDDDLFMWEQLKALDEDNQEEFWKNVYNIENHGTAEHSAYGMDSIDHAGVASLAGTDDDRPGSFRGESPSVRHADVSEKDDQHSDGDESSYSFI